MLKSGADPQTTNPIVVLPFCDAWTRGTMSMDDVDRILNAYKTPEFVNAMGLGYAANAVCQQAETIRNGLLDAKRHAEMYHERLAERAKSAATI